MSNFDYLTHLIDVEQRNNYVFFNHTSVLNGVVSTSTPSCQNDNIKDVIIDSNDKFNNIISNANDYNSRVFTLTEFIKLMDFWAFNYGLSVINEEPYLIFKGIIYVDTIIKECIIFNGKYNDDDFVDTVYTFISRNNINVNKIDLYGLCSLIHIFYNVKKELIVKKFIREDITLQHFFFRPHSFKDKLFDGSFSLLALSNIDWNTIYKYSVIASGIVIPNLISNIRTESIKSAVSAIMARNMSHNLGSHFLSNTKNYFGNLAEKVKDGSKEQKEYRGLRHALQYIQERMDFIATIVSSDKFPYGPVNVKSQIFDELTPDELGNRHNKKSYNFLLDFLVYSESISKQSIDGNNTVKLSVGLIYQSENDSTPLRFGFDETIQNAKDEEAKEAFARMNIALPGGILGRHAIFTIIENVIRNSAKHDKQSLHKNDGLRVSMRIAKDEIIIFDNKQNAYKILENNETKTILDQITGRFDEIKILDNGAIDKANKGLKEILISALWINNINISEWLLEYESIVDKRSKLSEVIEVIPVDDNGNPVQDNKPANLGYKIKMQPFELIHRINDQEISLGNNNHKYIVYNELDNIKADIIVAKEDVYVLTNPSEEIKDATPKLSNIFPRFVQSDDLNESAESLMRKLIKNRYGEQALNINIDVVTKAKGEKLEQENKDSSKTDVQKPQVGVGYGIYNYSSEVPYIENVPQIIFKRHLSTNPEEIAEALKLGGENCYVDSVSGGDFTQTITQSFFLDDEINRLKIIESALCKIVIIDERIFSNYAKGVNKPEYSAEIIADNEIAVKANEIYHQIESIWQQRGNNRATATSIKKILQDEGVKISSLDRLNSDAINKYSLADLLEDLTNLNEDKIISNNKNTNTSNYHSWLHRKNTYVYNIDTATASIIAPNGKCNYINKYKIGFKPIFLSIHLSLIEGLVKQSNKDVKTVVDTIKMAFGEPEFMMVHSGRGNLSKELEYELKDMAFLSLSAIEASLYDSKFFLSQLLNNGCYFGKGKINQ